MPGQKHCYSDRVGVFCGFFFALNSDVYFLHAINIPLPGLLAVSLKRQVAAFDSGGVGVARRFFVPLVPVAVWAAAAWFLLQAPVLQFAVAVPLR